MQPPLPLPPSMALPEQPMSPWSLVPPPWVTHLPEPQLNPECPKAVKKNATRKTSSFGAATGEHRGSKPCGGRGAIDCCPTSTDVSAGPSYQPPPDTHSPFKQILAPFAGPGKQKDAPSRVRAEEVARVRGGDKFF